MNGHFLSAQKTVCQYACAPDVFLRSPGSLDCLFQKCQDLQLQTRVSHLLLLQHIAGLLTNVVALDGGLRGPEPKTDVLVPSPAALAHALGLAALTLGVEEDVRLLLESALGLDGQFGGHDCGICRGGMAKGSGRVVVVVRVVEVRANLKVQRALQRAISECGLGEHFPSGSARLR